MSSWQEAFAWATPFYLWFDSALLFYMSALLFINLVLILVGWSTVNRYVTLRPLRDYRYVGESALSLPVSIIVPGYNEEPTIVESVRSLLLTQFTQLEVVVVNDGSTDGTLPALVGAFELIEVERVPRSGLPTQPIQAIYMSPIEPRLVVIDKANGGKADALNAGLNYAQFPLFCAIDADTMLDPDALARLVWEFQSDPDTIATGGIVRIINGSQVSQGRITSITTPRSMLANIQIVEYLRAFLGGRLAWSRWNMLLIVSGAFGLFRRDVVVAAGGYDPDTVTEDAELILRIRRYRADNRQSCRITFFPDPICWTEAPVTLRQLARQRDRWHRGLGETLVKHAGMLFRPKYGRTAFFALPYYWLFEFLEPFVTVVGITLATLGLIVGLVDPAIYLLILAFAFAYGYFLSMVVILIEERAFRRYPNWVDLRRMSVATLVENFGYRQRQALVRFRAMFRIHAGRHHWGEMTRVGFGQPNQQHTIGTS